MTTRANRLPCRRSAPLFRGGWLLCAVAAAIAAGCTDAPAPRKRAMRFRGDNADVYLSSVSDTLNNLPQSLDLDLLPAQPILTAATSADGNEVRAICTTNPQMQGGPVNFLRAVDGNARFLSMGVEDGDIVRYYVVLDEDAFERDIEQRTAIELKVRRLDSLDPENALILQEAFQQPILDPARIEIWRISDKRADAIRSALNRYQTIRQPAAGWEPSPDLGALRQVVERANQWLRNLDDDDSHSWQVDPLVAAAGAEFREAKGVGPLLTSESLRNGPFAEWEGRLLEQAVWARDVSQWARRDAIEDLDAALALFDWTVRNIQLDDANDAPMVFHAWQALAYGRGMVEHRAWVFVELCRQQGIDAVILQPAAADAGPGPLLVGVFIDGGLRLFDPLLGLPIPGREDAVATLAEVVADPDLLRGLDVSDDLTYPLEAEQLDGAAAYIVATPLQLAQRAALLEAALQGEDFVRLSVDAGGLAKRLAETPHVGPVQLWRRPFQAIVDEFSAGEAVRAAARREFEPFAQCPILWQARVLHFQGHKDVRAEERGDPLAKPREGHLDALRLYQDDKVRPSADAIAKLEPSKQAYYRASKAAASYWLGLLSYDLGHFDVALAWLDDVTLKRDPLRKWASGARYNLARTYEALGRREDAIALLQATPEGDPSRHGNLLRAKRLAGAEQTADEHGAAEAPADGASDDN